jgi:hypothetical protein
MGNTLVLLAQAGGLDSIFTNMGAGLRSRNGVEWVALGKLVVLLAAVVLVFVLMFHLVRRLVRLWRSTPTWLFLRLCRAHGLSWSARCLLWRVAHELKMHDAAMVFLDPACIERASALPSFIDSGQALLELHTRLFVGADEEPPEVTPRTTPITAGPGGTTTGSEIYRRPSDAAAALEDVALNELLTPHAGLPPLEWPNLPATGTHDSPLP